MSFGWRKTDETGSALLLLNARSDYPSERVARFRLACGHLMGCYNRDHKHVPHKSTMFCDEHMGWAEVVGRAA